MKSTISIALNLMIVLCTITTYVFFFTTRKTYVQTTIHKSPIQYTTIKASKKNFTKPIMIIHIGPRKTGTSTIQESLFESKKRLKKDNFIYIEKYDVCFRDYFDGHKCDLEEVRDFNYRLARLHSSKKNVILSSDRLIRSIQTKDDFDYLLRKLHGWDVRIVVAYRRYFDWLLSEYNQECHKGKGFYRFASSLAGYYQQLNRNELYKPLEPSVLDVWKQHFDDVYVFNMYSDNQVNNNSSSKDDLFTRFICEAIPEAEDLCHALTTESFLISNAIRENTADDKATLDALLITAALIRKNIVKYAQWRNTINIMNGHLSSINDMKHTCLSKHDLDEVYNISMTLEKDLLPDFHQSMNGGPMLTALFTKAVSENKFCQVDANY